MKIQILSDLHLEFRAFEIPCTDADVVILAGDIHVGTAGVQWALQTVKDKPVIYVLGNHEYYKHTFPDLSDTLKTLSKGSNLHVLENDSVIIDNVRFLGCTLWTDFMLTGNPEIAEFQAQQMLPDYHAIHVSPNYRKLQTADTIDRHRQSRQWLTEQLADNGLPTVVVTHHAPAIQSLAKQYHGNPYNPAFISDMADIVTQSNARYWIHGHTHTAFDYRLGNTRVLCNPRGYPGEAMNRFDPALTVTV